MTAASDVLEVLRPLLALAFVSAGGVWLIVCVLVDQCRRRRAETRREHEARVAAQVDRDRLVGVVIGLRAELYQAHQPHAWQWDTKP